ncbi:BrxA/BrxB family bacilliredoxin [Vicingaceae bacterium]|jgi:putative YphP/YqiW family bacilliredoxin|nr:BrxA/BrxB family bacilliredoxin [Vicingaceae bacterium]
MYPPELVAPMKEELTSVGFEDLTTVEQVDAAITAEGTTLVIINSVCGCAAANARPAAKMSIANDKKPNRITTVFAGVDGEAVAQARKYMLPYPPSSPSMALFKNGKIVHCIERHHIEGRPAEMIAENLAEAFNEYC